MYKSNEKYSRREIVNTIRMFDGNVAQGAYFNIYNKEKNKILAKVIFINKESIYNDFLNSRISLNWADSLNKKNTLGKKFLNTNIPIYIFFEATKKPKKYFFLGQVKSWNQIIFGNKEKGIPNEFEIIFYEKVSEVAYKEFTSEEIINRKNDLRIITLNNSFGAPDYARARAISVSGEKIFNKSLKNKGFKNIKKEIKDEFFNNEIQNFKWINKKTEKYKAYDFIIENKFFDIKATITNLEKFYISKNEYDLIKTGDLNIILIWLDKNLEYKKHKIINNHELKTNYFFEPKKYLVYKKENSISLN